MFGRSKECCAFFIQPLVPVLTVEGNWAMAGPLDPYFKPGGHGVIWKAAKDQGILDRLRSLGAKKCIVRQINNPVAGVDQLLYVLSGIGCRENKQFGFASCPRLVHAAEGMNVLIERKNDAGYAYGISNVEYTDFTQYGIQDVAENGTPYSCFPANTNVLFADLDKMGQVAIEAPFPGAMVNLKTRLLCDSPEEKKEMQCGRLESLMQNIADSLLKQVPDKLTEDQQKELSTFVVYNARSKTISTAKKAYEPGKSIVETPEGCFYELMQNYRELLENDCGMKLPPQECEKEYVESGPSFIALFHPALGPLFQVIGQKIHGGCLAKNSEWVMEIAEAEVIDLDLDGSLLVEAEDVMGRRDNDCLKYSSNVCGKCILHNVRVRNRGHEGVTVQQAWKQQYPRKEALTIRLHGNAEFVAQNVLFEGDFLIDVPDGYRMTAIQKGETIEWLKEKISRPSWFWHYAFDEDNSIKLKFSGTP